MYLAFKYVALCVMIAEANFNADRLNLPIRKPILQTNLTWAVIAPPSTLKDDGFGGSIHVDHYSFDEGGRPGYRYIARLDPFGSLSVAEQNEMLSHQKSLVDTNGAYKLATNWLASIDVNVRGLEMTNKVEVQQRWFWGAGGRQTMCPIFEVRWGGWDHAKVKVTVDGRTKQFIEIRQEDDSFSRRPRELVKDVDKLLAIPDEEFVKYSATERRNLVVRFSFVNYWCSSNSVAPGNRDAEDSKRTSPQLGSPHSR